MPSMQDWSIAHGVEESNPFRTGKIIVTRKTGAYVVVLADEITPDMQGSVIGGMEACGYIDEAQPLRDDSPAFLVHLLLRELAHAQFPDATEIECDDHS